MGESGILEIFMGEAREIIENLESDIVHLEENSGDEEIINRIFRYFHTLKGSSGIAGLNTVYEFSHKLENLLDLVRSGDLSVSDDLIDLILKSIDWIRDEIFSEDSGSDKAKEKAEGLVKLVNKFRGEDASEGASEEESGKEEEATDVTGETSGGFRYYNVKTIFKEDIFGTGTDPLMIIEDLLNHGTLLIKNVNRNNLPDFDTMDPEVCYLGWDLIIKTVEPLEKIKDVFLFVMDDNDIIVTDVTVEFTGKEPDLVYLQEKKIGEIMIEKGLISEDELEEVIKFQDSQKKKLGDIIVEKGYASEDEVEDALEEQEIIKKKIEVTTVRVDTGRLDNLMNLLGEIVIGQSSLVQIADVMGDDNEVGYQLTNALYGLDRITREFQEQIMSIRMIPVGPTFEQFRRFVRDSAHALKKKISLEIQGAETELDKTVIEKIGDPLKHMIRNAIDHAIEPEKERKALGKDPRGKVTLKAYHQEGSVYIEVIDDGKGIDPEKIKKIALEKGLLKEGDEISKDKLFDFLFYPGFSTAGKVGDLSGRGVGMDVVKTNIEELRGTVEIKSEIGVGSTVKIKLPLTLAIIDGMLVSIGDHIYIIPLLSIVESMQPKEEDIKDCQG